MLGFIIGIAVLLIIAILVTIFRVQNLVNVARGADKKLVTPGNKINAIMFIIFMVVGGLLMAWYSYTRFEEYTIPVASEHGVEIDTLFWVTMAITGVVFIATHILLFIFPYQYRFREESKALFYPDNNRLELLWTVVPAIVLAILIFSGWRTWSDITEAAPEDAEVVEILGYQFAWTTRYPGKDNQLGNFDYRLIDAENHWGMDFSDKSSFDDFSSMEVHVPKGKPVLFKIRARDVLHSVYVPEFRMKMDAVPGMPTNFWFTPTKTTAEMKQETGNPDFDYYIFCTEICGRGHFSMRLKLVVDEPEEYEAWYAEQKPWLQKNPDYLTNVPIELKEVAALNAGLDNKNIETKN